MVPRNGSHRVTGDGVIIASVSVGGKGGGGVLERVSIASYLSACRGFNQDGNGRSKQRILNTLLLPLQVLLEARAF